MAADAAGDVFYVAHNHAETTAAAITLNCAGTEATPSYLYCVTSAGSVPPVPADLRTTGTVSTTGASGITINGSFYCYGLTFTAGNGASAAGFVLPGASTAIQLFDTCVFTFGGTATATFQCGLSASTTYEIFKSCTINFSATGQTASFFKPVIMQNCTIGGSAIPTSLFSIQTTAAYLLVDGCDLSAFGAAKNLMSTGTHNPSVAQFRNCKLGASVIVSTSTLAGILVDVINCDSGDVNYRSERYTREGALTTETTIVRTGGATDGTTPIAWKIVTAVSAEVIQPFECPPIAIWNETVGSAVTATVEGTWGGGAVPTNANIWIEAQYLGTSGFPLGLKATNGQTTPLHTATNQTASAEVWGGGTTDFKMAVTFTPQEKGWIYIHCKAGLASTTFYVDPKITLS